jgi:pimeloyl-ACP methyl ester carboxylesterase
MIWDHLLLIGKILLAIYIALLLMLALTQCTMVYYPNLPSRDLVSSPKQIGLSYENVQFVTDDGEQLHGWYIPAREDSDVLLFFHGNAGNISHRLDSIDIFHRLELAVFIFDYRGYGNSSGKSSESGTYRDAEAAFRYLIKERKVNPGRLIYFGRSLGGAVASHLAVQHPPKALILESTFTSAPDMASRLFPIFPIRWLTRFSYSNIGNLKSIHCPVLIVHSPDDEIIPYDLGRKLYEAANQPKQFLQIHGGHNEGFMQSEKIYSQGLKEFLQTLKSGESL